MRHFIIKLKNLSFHTSYLKYFKWKFSCSALQDKESSILNSEILMKNKEAEFLEQIEQEKASALTLLQVERQVWEANRAQGLPGKHKETE